ncbi:lipid II:glycine glycyltransferase FemX [soil metagenome]
MIELVEHHHPGTWDALVGGYAYRSALQGWGWGEVKAATGWSAHRLELPGVAAAQVLRKGVAPGLSMLYAPRGPALGSLGALADFAGALRRWARPSDVYFKIEPEVPRLEGEPIPAALAGFRRAESLQPEHTVFLDLNRSEDDLLKNMHGMARRNVKKSLKEGVETRLERSLEAFWPLFAETNARSRLLQFERAYYETVLHACDAYGGEAFAMTAYHGGEALASGLFVAFGERVYYLYGGSSRERSEARAPYAVHWAVMRLGRENGYASYDLWGIPRELSPQGHAYGVYQFKERFGGYRLRLPAYDLPLSPLYGGVTGAIRLRKSWRNYRARGSADDVL